MWTSFPHLSSCQMKRKATAGKIAQFNAEVWNSSSYFHIVLITLTHYAMRTILMNRAPWRVALLEESIHHHRLASLPLSHPTFKLPHKLASKDSYESISRFSCESILT